MCSFGVCGMWVNGCLWMFCGAVGVFVIGVCEIVVMVKPELGKIFGE